MLSNLSTVSHRPRRISSRRSIPISTRANIANSTACRCWCAQADYNIAYLYFLRGEYSRAIDMLRSTRTALQ